MVLIRWGQVHSALVRIVALLTTINDQEFVSERSLSTSLASVFDGSNSRMAWTISPDRCGECLTGVVSSTNTILISENDNKVQNFMHSCTVQTSCLLCCKTHQDLHLYRVMSGRRVGKLSFYPEIRLFLNLWMKCALMRAAHPGTNVFVKPWNWKRGRAAEDQKNLQRRRHCWLHQFPSCSFFPDGGRRPTFTRLPVLTQSRIEVITRTHFLIER